MSQKITCNDCGCELPSDAPAGLCPKCLLKAGMGDCEGNAAEYATLALSTDASTQNERATKDDVLQDVEAPSIGTKVKYFGDYELLNEIARGGMGVVYMARQVRLNRLVALKMILAGQFAGEGDVQRFHTEAEAAAQLDHPGIVPIIEVGEYEGHHFFSMGLVDGESLGQRIAESPLPPRESAELVRKIATAIQYAHEKGVIHRDLKPANILIDGDGQPRVTDFGLAKRVKGDSHLTATGQILGTPSYMPPEQASGQINRVTETADVYSLGAVLYATLTGRPPFATDNPLDTLMQVLERDPISPTQLNPAAPRDLVTICLKCLQKDRRNRYASMQLLADDLGRFLNNQPILARPTGPLERASKLCRRRPAVAALIATVLLGIMGTIAGGAWHLRSVTNERNRAESAEALATVQRDRALRSEEAAKQQRNRAIEVTEAAMHDLGRALYQRARAQLAANEPGRRSSALEALRGAEALGNVSKEDIADPSTTDGQTEFEWETALKQLEKLAGKQPTIAEIRTQAVTASLTKDANVLHAWEGQVQAISPGGRFVANVTLHASKEDSARLRVVDTASGDTVLDELGGAQKMAGTVIAVGAQGKRLAIATLDFRSINLIELPSGDLLRTLTFPASQDENQTEKASPLPEMTRVMTFSPDGRWLVATRFRGTGAKLVLWDLNDNSQEKGRVIATAAKNPLLTPVFTPDSQQLGWSSAADTITLWNLSQSDEERQIKLPLKKIASAFAFTSDGSRLIVHGRSREDSAASSPRGPGLLVVWDMNTNQTLNQFETDPSFVALACGLSRDDRHVAVGQVVGEIKIFDLRDGEKFTMDHGAMVQQIVWTPDGRRLISAGVGVSKQWDVSIETPLTVNRLADEGRSSRPILGFALSPDAATAAIEFAGETKLGLYDLMSGRRIREFETARKQPFPSIWLKFDHDGKRLMRFDMRETLIWNVDDDSEPARVDMAMFNRRVGSSVGLSEGGTLLLAGLDRGLPTVKTPGSDEVVWQATSKSAGIVRLSLDGTLVVTHAGRMAGHPHSIEVHALPGGEMRQRVASMAQGWNTPTAIDVSPDNRFLIELDLNSPLPMTPTGRFGPSTFTANVLGGINQTWKAALWNMATGERHWKIEGDANAESVAWSADSRYLAVSQRNGRVVLWDIDQKQRLFDWHAWEGMQDLGGITRELAFTADGHKLVIVDPTAPGLRMLDLDRLQTELNEIGLGWQ